MMPSLPSPSLLKCILMYNTGAFKICQYDTFTQKKDTVYSTLDRDMV